MVIINRRASFDYERLESFNAGLVLLGTEVKSIKFGNASLSETFCFFNSNELFCKFNISEYKFGNMNNHVPDRDKKLLLTKKELKQLFEKVTIKGLTIIPYKIYINKGLIKMEIWLAKGKRDWDKRQSIKEKDSKREIEQIKKASF